MTLSPMWVAKSPLASAYRSRSAIWQGLRTFFREHIAPYIKMFATPAQSQLNGESIYIVSLPHPECVGIRLSVNESGIVPTFAYQDQLQAFRKHILTELCKHKQLFRYPPALESLEAITPQWGFIVKDGAAAVSPYTQIDVTVGTQIPCDVDLVLAALIVSRSTIRPRFETVYLKPNVIDFDWCAAEELEEVSDIQLDSSDSLELRDPVSIRAKEKQDVRAAFQRASDARAQAE
jgi:hypothetical protein